MTTPRKCSPGRTHAWCFVQACIALLLFSCGSCAGDTPADKAGAQRAGQGATKNVVIYLVDTLRADHLGCYGYERKSTPRIDAFAAESLLFLNCIAQSTWTKPASASVLTGLYPSQHGMLSEAAVLPTSVMNIAGLLGDGPLATGAFVGNQYVWRPQGEMLRGFDFERGYSSKPPNSHGAPAAQIVDAALRWIENQGEKQFLVYVHTIDPHAPYGDQAPFDRQFIDPDASDIDGRFVLDSTKEELSKISAADRQRLIDLYDGDVAYTDHQFGRFLDGLERLGHAENTMIVFVADHGEEFNEHGSWQHNPFMHPEVLKVPLIMRMPKSLRAGFQGKRRDLCAQVDVVPSVLDALGLWPRPGLSGRSLLHDPGAGDLPPVFSEIEGGTSLKAMNAGNYKYVRQWSPTHREELYDLAQDPDERADLSASQPELLAQHRAQMDAYVAQVASGYSLLFQNAGEDWVRVDCLLQSRLPLERLKLIYADTKARHGAKRDGPPELAQSDAWHEARIRMHVKPKDGDGISFALPEGLDELRISIEVDGQPADHQYVRMGPEEQRSTQWPLVLQRSAAAKLALPQPQARVRFQEDPYRILLWSNMRAESAEVPISAQEREALEAIGYAGEEEEE